MPHSHDPGEAVDEALTTSRDGMRTLWISMAILGITAALQAIVVWISGSVALLGDTVHNLGDALTAIPLPLPSPLEDDRPAAGTPTATGGPKISPAS